MLARTDFGVGDALHALHVDRAHEAELLQIAGLAIDVRAAVDEQKGLFAPGDHRGQRRALDAADAADAQHAAGQERARGAGGDHGVRLALAHGHDRLDQDDSVFWRTASMGESCMPMTSGAWTTSTRSEGRSIEGPERVLRAVELHGDVGKFFHGQLCALDDCACGALSPAHGVQRDGVLCQSTFPLSCHCFHSSRFRRFFQANLDENLTA